MNEELKEKIGGISKYQIKQIYQHVNFMNKEILNRIPHEEIKDSTFLTYISCIRVYLFHNIASKKLKKEIYDYLDTLKATKLVYLTPPEGKQVKIVPPGQTRKKKKIVETNPVVDKKSKMFSDFYKIEDIHILSKLYPQYLKSTLQNYMGFFRKLRNNSYELLRNNSYPSVKKLFADQLIQFMKGTYNFDNTGSLCEETKDLNQNTHVEQWCNETKCEDECSKEVSSIIEYAIIDDRNHIFARNASYDFILGAYTVFKLYESSSEFKIVKFESIISE